MSGTLSSNHISGCLTKNNLNTSKNEKESDSISSNSSADEVDWKKIINPNLEDSILNDFNITKNCKKSPGDNCDIINKDVNSCNGISSVNKENDNLESSDKDMKAALTKIGKVVEHLGLTRSNPIDNNQVFYYGVHIPHEPGSVVVKNDDGEEEVVHVYTDKAEALKVVKQFKKARFKQFKSETEALDFALNGDDSENLLKEHKYPCVSGGEKFMPFKCPKTQDMVKFRKAIECGDVGEVRKKIWENPRYLVSNGDTPSILQEGCRYNALHIAAKAKNAEIARLILDCITDTNFFSYLYDDNNYESCRSRADILLDLYLNMPDKALNETPLHLASKLGAVQVVELLTSYPQCKRNLLNKFHQMPKDIICDRVTPESSAVIDAIAAKLEDQYFIPVLRYEDNSMQPKIGKVFSPSEPLQLEENPLSPRLEIQAFAGPMTKDEAEIFERKWKTPPRSARRVRSSTPQSSLRLCDAEKGLERIGRDLASEFKVPWKEYWSFLNTFVDLSSSEGLQMLENYLKTRFRETLEDYLKRIFEETLQMVKDSNEGELMKDGGGEVLSPMSDLCEAFKACTLNDNQNYNLLDLDFRRARKVVGFRENEKRDGVKDKNSKSLCSCKKLQEPFETDARQPLLYVEKSCEVFGRRIANAMFNVCSAADIYKVNTDALRDCLEPEVKHLLSLITSYHNDSRFQSVDFQLVHSRVATVAVETLNELITDDDKKLIFASLKEIDLSDGTLSDDEDQNYGFRDFNNDLIGLATTKQQLHCLVKHLMDKLQDSSTCRVKNSSVRNEDDCHIIWATCTPCSCSWNNSQIRARPGAKRKTFKILKSSLDCDILPTRSRRLIFEDEREEAAGIEISVPGKSQDLDDEDYFSTPPSQSSDSEDDNMEDPMEIPDTFIYPGSGPSKTDFAVLDAIDKIPISSEKYPNIYRWRHLVQLHSKSNFPTPDNREGWHRRRLSSFNSPTPSSSPYKLLNLSTSSCDTPNRSSSVEPWERITGAYTPKKAVRSNHLIFSKQPSPVTR